ncbi:RHS repeat-associated core domain-containing protein [Pseudomonas fluorescens]|uniref:RHS repeat-associated core domain-containing protein n=1 Tax=Pseudomonas TaxID=286 RepID=UPI003CFFD831
MTHANTPTIAVIDPCAKAVRAVAYHRRKAGDTTESHITQQVYDTAGRAVHSRDPRLFQLLEGGSGEAVNQSTVFSLSGTALLSENGDAGWRLGLFGAAGQRLQGWDQKRNQSRAIHDDLLRPSAIFEQAQGQTEHCTERFSYADATAETAAHNRCGRLIRIDDTAGTQHFTEFSLAGAPLEQSRQFIADPQSPVNWPEVETERDALLELEPAITRVRYNAVGEPCEQTDAGGNRQIFSQTRAGELREVRLKLDSAAEEKTLVSAIRYNAFGQIEQQLAGNGVKSCATYAVEDGKLLQLKARALGKAPRQDLTYDYDPVGNIRSISDAAQAIRYFRNERVAAINTYEYDSLHRLIFASGRQTRNAPSGPHLPVFQSPADPGQLENYQQTFHYDPANNLERLQHTADSNSRTEHTAVASLNNRSLPYSADGKRPDEDEIRAGYDDNGNLNTLQPGQPLLWDLRNQLRQVDQVEREEEPNDAELYLYDSNGQRQWKIRTAYTGTLTHTHETRYLPGLEIRTGPKETLHVITVQAGRCTVQVLHWKKGQRVDIPENQHRYTFTDHLGSSTMELDDHAELISQECYYPYGGTCWWAGRDKVEASYKTFRYSGKERDATGLCYYGHRYYLPWRQRWLSADPAGATDGLNLYAMVHGNPIRLVDTQGLFGVDTLYAAGATLVREGGSALVSATLQYGATMAIGAMSPVGSLLTAMGALSGWISGGVTGYAEANRALSTSSTNSRARILTTKVSGILVGASIGAAPSLIGHFTSPGVNTAAVSQIASGFGSAVREGTSQYVSHVGPSNPSTPYPSVKTAGTSIVAAASVGGAFGYAGGQLMSAVLGEAGKGLEAILVGSAATATSAAAASLVRGIYNTPTKPAKGGEPTFDIPKAITGITTRHAFASLGLLADQAVVNLVPGYMDLDPVTKNMIKRALGTAIGDQRAIITTSVTEGLAVHKPTTENIEMSTIRPNDSIVNISATPRGSVVLPGAGSYELRQRSRSSTPYSSRPPSPH